MKRYDCYYKDDFRQEYPALSKPAEDGDWALYEDAQAAIGEWKNLAHQREYTISKLRAELHSIRNQSLEWAMSCPHDCPACDAMYEVIKGAQHPRCDSHEKA